MAEIVARQYEFHHETEVVVLRWSETNKGATITLQLPPLDIGEGHPFKGMEGVRLRMQFDPMLDAEAPPAPPESVPLPVKNGDASDRAKAAYRDKDVMAKAVVRASVLCAEEAFQNWIWTHDGTASLPPGGDPAKRERTTASLLRGALGISSRSLIGTAPDVYEAFLALETDYKIAVGRAAAPR